MTWRGDGHRQGETRNAVLSWPAGSVGREVAPRNGRPELGGHALAAQEGERRRPAVRGLPAEWGRGT
eukprot:8398426-Alexandrium_andersonii.AAC.1